MYIGANIKNVSIIIPAYIIKADVFKLTKNLLDNLFFKTKHINNCEIILVDDGSNINFIIFLRRFFSKLKIISNGKNLGFAAAVNAGIRESKNDLILLLNNDVEILESGWLVNLINGMNYFKADIVAPKQSMLDDKYEYIPDVKIKQYIKEKYFTYPVGWCLLVKRDVFSKVGLLPLNFGIGFWEDTAWFFNIKNNYPDIKIHIVEHIYKNQINHIEHATFKSLNINITEQYNHNRKIFLDIISGKIQLNLPFLDTIMGAK